MRAHIESAWLESQRKREREALPDATFWLFACQMAASYLLYLFPLALGHLFSHADFGELAVFLSVVFAFSLPLAVLRTATCQAIARALEEGEPDLAGREALERLLGVSLVAVGMALAAWGLEGPLARFLRLGDPTMVVLLGGYLALSLPLAAVRGVLEGQKHHHPLGLNILGEALFSLGMAAALLLAGLGLRGLATGYLLGCALALILALSALGPVALPRAPRVSLRLPRRVNCQGLAMLALVACPVAMANLDILLVKHFYPPIAAGIYAAAALLAKATLPMTPAALGLLLSRMAAKAETPGELRASFRQALGWMGLPALGLSLVYVAAPRTVVQMVYGPKYLAASSLVSGLGLAMLLYSLATIFLAYHLAFRRTRAALGAMAFLAMEIALLAGQGMSLPGVATVLFGSMAGLLAYLALHAWASLQEKGQRPSPAPWKPPSPR